MAKHPLTGIAAPGADAKQSILSTYISKNAEK
jgi:hypothetical protein